MECFLDQAPSETYSISDLIDIMKFKSSYCVSQFEKFYVNFEWENFDDASPLSIHMEKWEFEEMVS